jgi:hypothetical protein
MVVHDLKTWPTYFDAVECGLKTFEVREDDRNFKEGDILVLREYNPNRKTYSGRVQLVKVNYICNLPFDSNYVGMSIERVDEIS